MPEARFIGRRHADAAASDLARIEACPRRRPGTSGETPGKRPPP